MFKSKLIKQIVFYSVSAIVIAFIAYYGLASNVNKKQAQDTINTIQTADKEVVDIQKENSKSVIASPSGSPAAVATQAPKSENPKASTTPQPTATSTTKPVAVTENKVESTPIKKSVQNIAGITINKSDITSTAKFYPITVDGINMEILAVKATDGSIRTALNTCQVCYSSGRGYYVQTGNMLVCQNCKNRFSVDQIEVVKGGCNPVPILDENKVDNGNSIFVAEAFLKSQKDLFLTWKR